ncbi:MAG: 1-deoxy-D-xylulose-5-phosphate reductoisomerase [Halieaceae bacterium]
MIPTSTKIRGITILGSTGSIGCNTLDVVRRHPDRYRVIALTANKRIGLLAEQCRAFQPQYAVTADPDLAAELEVAIRDMALDTKVLSGVEGLSEAAAHPAADLVMAAIVGAAGLEPTLSAVAAGKTILLANKEALVMAGQLFMDCVQQSGATLLPIDSEHNAIFQCLPRTSNGVVCATADEGVRKILLTASGGPFRNWSVAEMEKATPEQACAHPNWDMGQKISIDSATLMNKGLELIEACRLFGVGPERIEIVVHPQSVVHSMVEYADGSVLAQLGNPDMRTPIAYGMAWPERIDSGVAALDLIAGAALEFEAPDETRFPSLRLAREAAQVGGTATTVLNAANEVAVAAFIDGKIPFTGIARLVEKVLEDISTAEPQSLAEVKEADALARQVSGEYLRTAISG